MSLAARRFLNLKENTIFNCLIQRGKCPYNFNEIMFCVENYIVNEQCDDFQCPQQKIPQCTDKHCDVSLCISSSQPSKSCIKCHWFQPQRDCNKCMTSLRCVAVKQVNCQSHYRIFLQSIQQHTLHAHPPKRKECTLWFG